MSAKPSSRPARRAAGLLNRIIPGPASRPLLRSLPWRIGSADLLPLWNHRGDAAVDPEVAFARSTSASRLRVPARRYGMSQLLFTLVVGTLAVVLTAGELPGETGANPERILRATTTSSAGSHSRASGTEFDLANQLYEKGRFADAIAAYERMLSAGPTSAAIRFNLGNAYFKSGQMGRAIFNYRLAGELAPRDPDIRANLQFARNGVGGGSSVVSAKWAGAIQKLTLNEWAVLAAAGLWTWCLLLALGQWRPAWKGALRGATGVALAGLMVFGAGLFLAWRIQLGSMSAVVIAREAVVRNGPLDESPSSYTVRDGAELEVLDFKDGWIQVRDAAGRVGWVHGEQVLTIPPAGSGRS